MRKLILFIFIVNIVIFIAFYILFTIPSNHTLITDCLNKGTKTFPLNNDSFIQCKNDKRKIIVCNDGVVNKNGVQTCKEYITTARIKFPHIKVPDNDDFIYVSENTILDTYNNLSLWPTYNVSNRHYYVTNCYYTSNSLIIETSKSSHIPDGFSWPKLDTNIAFRKLTLFGMNDIIADEKRQYYFTLTGSLAKLQLKNAIKIKREIGILEIVNSKKSETFTINWDKIYDTIIVFNNLKFHNNKTIEYNGNIIDGGYIVMRIDYKINEQTSDLHIGSDITIKFNNITYPTLHFTRTEKN